jgi:16S rRNA (guanine527-N7)-methyltransferase
MNATENLDSHASEPALPEFLDLWQETIGWQPDAAQLQQFQRLYESVLAGNRQLNLTRITEPNDFWEKHLWDSLRGIQSFLTPQSLSDSLSLATEQSDSTFSAIDIGTGAGFPGIPVAIVQPTWNVTLLDATRKKINFLNEMLASLDIQNAATWVDRVEQLGRSPRHRAHYDLALVRAVAIASVCAEYALPLVKLGGSAILYRGQWTEAEQAVLEPAVQQLGGEIETVEAFVTPLTSSDRHCIVIRKVAETPLEFPRAIGIPTQTPL